MKRPLMIGLAVMSIGAGVLTACGDDGDSDVGDANAAFCADLAEHGAAIGAFLDLDPATATKDDYESAADEIRSTREAMVESATDLSEAEWDNLQEQADALVDQLEDAPDDQAVQSVVEEAQTQADAVRASIATLNTAVCAPAGATTTTAG